MITIASVFLIFLVSAILTLFCVGAVRRYALAHQLLDVPNERSLHTVPTSRGGGVAVVAISSIGFFLLAWFGVLDYSLTAVLVGGGLAVAGIGLADDRQGVSRLLRLIVHIGAAVWAVYMLDGTPVLQIGTRLVELNGFWYPVSVVGIVWTLNLFNFMDGIDGIAASEAIFVALAGALLGFPMAVAAGVSVAAAVLAGSGLGFLVWNWPPAKIFMGDVGSQFLGFGFAAIAVIAAEYDLSRTSALVMPLLFFNFIFDTGLTFIRRLAMGQNVTAAHRSHLYQLMNRLGASHFRVSMFHFAVTAAQGLGVMVLIQLPAESRAWVFAPFVIFQIVYAVIVLRRAARSNLLGSQ